MSFVSVVFSFNLKKGKGKHLRKRLLKELFFLFPFGFKEEIFYAFQNSFSFLFSFDLKVGIFYTSKKAFLFFNFAIKEEIFFTFEMSLFGFKE